MRTALTLAPVYNDGVEATLSGAPGLYECVVVLGYPGASEFVADVDAQAFATSGRSLLMLPPPATNVHVDLSIEGQPYSIIFDKNALGEVAAVRATIQGDGLLAAEQLCHDNILPVVSWLAFQYDVGISICGWIITETASGLTRIRLGLLGASRPMESAMMSGELSQETRSLFASFREGSVSTNIFFQALCYWKVLEGVYSMRNRAAKAAAVRGEAPQRVSERIPPTVADIPYGDKWALAGFEQYLGMKFTRVRDDLRARLRNPLAHLLPGDQDFPPLNADVFNDVNTCEEVVPVLRFMARTLIRAHLGDTRTE